VAIDELLETCGAEPSTICRWTLDVTNSAGVAEVTDFVSGAPLRILFVLVAGFVLNRILRRLLEGFAARLADREDQTETPGRVNRSFLSDADRQSRVDARRQTLIAVLGSIVSMFLWAIVTLLVLGEVGISLAPLLAGAGVVGIALGFGAQSVVADFLAGAFMLIEDQYGVGDVIDVGDVSGTVEDVSLRITTLRDVNGTLWHVPNSEIRRVGNKSQHWSRAVLDIEVAYDTDLRRAAGIIQHTADELWNDESWVEADIIDPPEVWGVERLGADGVAIRLVVKTDPAEQWIVARELRLRIKDALDEAGIEMPFPQRTVWLRHDQAVPRADRPVVDLAVPRHPNATEDLVDNPE
jgi:small conductance mechanosensitive channel